MNSQMKHKTTARITIRPRTSEDLPASARLLIDVHQSDGYPVEGVSDAESWISPPDMIMAWVASLDDRLVGHVLLSSPSSHVDPARTWISQGQALEEVVVLARLFVHRDARGHGVGKKLVRAASDWVTREGKRILLDVMAKDEAAVHLYESLGWQRMMTLKHDNGLGNEFGAFIYISPKAYPDGQTIR